MLAATAPTERTQERAQMFQVMMESFVQLSSEAQYLAQTGREFYIQEICQDLQALQPNDVFRLYLITNTLAVVERSKASPRQSKRARRK